MTPQTITPPRIRNPDHWRVYPSLTPCVPRDLRVECMRCARLRDRVGIRVREGRAATKSVVIDASTLPWLERCPMRVDKA